MTQILRKCDGEEAKAVYDLARADVYALYQSCYINVVWKIESDPKDCRRGL